MTPVSVNQYGLNNATIKMVGNDRIFYIYDDNSENAQYSVSLIEVNLEGNPNSPINNGGLILGICNGFQILTETSLLPGVLLRNKKLRFISKNVFLKVININNQFCLNYKKKNIIKLPIAHNEGNYFANNELLKKLEDKNLIAFKYCNEKGDINETSNPNGSSNNIAGILNNEKNILGMMPHPERLIDPLLSGEDGSIMFESLLKSN